MKRPHLLNIFNYKLFNWKNKTYLSHINKLTSTTSFKEQLLLNNVQIEYLDKSISSIFYNEVFIITSSGDIEFLHNQNLIKFIFKQGSLNKSTLGLVNINIKNQQSYELILCIVKLQNKFIQSNNKQDLKYISHKEVLDFHKKHYSTSLINSNISTISNNTSYRDRNNKIFKLNFLLPKQYFIIYVHIKYILNIYPKSTDKELSFHLYDKFKIKSTSMRVYNIRKRYFIPSKSHRMNDIYKEYEKKYFDTQELNRDILLKYKGYQVVYELISTEKHQYNYKLSTTIYIGSTKDISRRLVEYIDNHGHTQKIRDFTTKNKLYFRFIKTHNYKDLEKDILDAFYITYGDYPLLNTNRILQ